MPNHTHDYDLFVIGAGSGGVRAARRAAARGMRVAIAEASRLGGTCVNLGCIPKKLMFFAAGFADAFADAAGFGWRVGEPRFAWPDLIAAKDAEIARLNRAYGWMLEGVGAEVLHGRARIADRHTVELEGERFTTGAIVVATGSRPFVPEVPGAGLGVVSDAIFSLPELPRRVAIIGGGYIAVEFAGILHGLGAAVTLFHRGPLPLRGFDDDVRATLAGELVKRGIELRLNTEVGRLESSRDGVRVVDRSGGSTPFDLVLWATGRVPSTGDLGLEEIGVELGGNGEVVVDEYSETTVPEVYAIGDCTDRLALTPVAIAEAMALVETLAGNPTPIRHDNVPTAVFSRPEVGAVGLTEAAARAAGHPVVVFRSTFRPLLHRLAGRDQATMMKLVVDGATDRVLGVHMVGPDAGEIIQGFAVALTCGATKAQLDATVAIHPTAAEELVTMREPVED
ncbi:MAG: glutathione-disulfide reductase [Thermoanaerobaculales bacterium]|jgi:glutathione reductase (NADPH)|nr:glutathione-disulfide reductase [Thermoanaerobaculales bacterium]